MEPDTRATASRASGATLVDAALITRPPAPLRVGLGTAVFLDGRCSHPRRRISDLRLRVGEAEHPVTGYGMPLPGQISSGDYWWSIVPFEAIESATAEPIELSAHLAGDGTALGSLGVLELDPGPRANGREVSDGAGADPGSDRVAICMASFDPPMELFERQIESIRAQTHDNWICLISDDGSRPERLEAMREVIGGDERFALAPSEQRRGFYGNFERALGMVPADAEHVVLCDQDDRWFPDKLETLLEALEPSVNLVYSDMRIVASNGQVLSDTYWSHRRNNYTDFASLMITNTVTGAASLFRREVLDYALPFPPRHGGAYHDHWIATCALATGRIGYVDRPLYDYVQHGEAALGHARANAGALRKREVLSYRVRKRLRRLRVRRFHPGWRARYFDIYCRTALAARVLEMRCGSRMDPAKRRVLGRIISSEASVSGAGWLALRSLRPLVGHDETVGRERIMLRGVAWRRLASARARMQARRGEGADVRRAGPSSISGPAGSGAGAGSTDWLQPLLVDYFARDGSTLMMRLLATSPNVAIEDQYPYERKYFSYLWRWARLLDRPDGNAEGWAKRQLGSISQEIESPLMGPPPWSPRTLLEREGDAAMSGLAFQHAWTEFSRRAIAATREEHSDPHAEVRYYAEKHLNTWLVDIEQLPPIRLVVVLRDPRDTYASILAFDRLRGTAGFGQERALTEAAHLEEVLIRQRQRLAWIVELREDASVPIVRYEDMVRDLDGVARGLEEDLGISLDPRIAARDRRLRRMHVTASSPDESVGRWRSELSDQAASAFTERLGPEMRELGFET